VADHGAIVSADPDRLCRAEMRVEGPVGTWTARFASRIYDEPQAVLWDTAGLLLVSYGFHLYALSARSGELRWTSVSAVPLVETFVSSRLPHAVVQSQLETRALDQAGSVVWRVALNDVIAEAALLGGRLVLTGASGAIVTLDPMSGQTTA
jgi:outer membrane protein assembly factor BamB